MLTVSLLNHSLLELQSVLLLNDAEKLCAEQHPPRRRTTALGSTASTHWWYQSYSGQILSEQNYCCFSAQATQLRNQYTVMWSTLLRGFWRFMNKTKQQQKTPRVPLTSPSPGSFHLQKHSYKLHRGFYCHQADDQALFRTSLSSGHRGCWGRQESAINQNRNR